MVIPCTKYCVASSSREIVSVAIQCMSPYSVLISVSIYAIQYLSPYSECRHTVWEPLRTWGGGQAKLDIHIWLKFDKYLISNLS